MSDEINFETSNVFRTDQFYSVEPIVSGPKSFVFKSDDFETNPNLCVLIHGSGVVRAGQWARRLIMNENLDLGTIMSDVMMAKERGFAVLVMNTNDNAR